MAKTCSICYYFEDDWNNWGQFWCTYYKSWTDLDYAEKCNHFKPESSSGGCYLTTACVEHKGLPDNCLELNTLRHFRDEYLMYAENGKEQISEYYRTAPGIVEAIEKSHRKAEIYESLYEDVILPCVDLINDGRNEDARKKYTRMVEALKKEYC